jgi:hypothetical protein
MAMMRAQKNLLAISIALLAAVTLYSCGGEGGGGGSARTATVSAYVTDDLGGYDSVVLTLNSVQLRHTSGRSCEIIRGPLEFDAAELGRDQLVEQVDSATCEAGPYNRLYVEVDDDVTLRQTAGGQPQSCKFVSYYDDNSNRPNRLACANGICSLNITGAVNLVAGNREHVALDADLKQFTVVTNGTSCEVTLKVSPLRAGDKLAAGFRMSLFGTVSNLDAAADRFTLSVAGNPHTVQYAGVTDQPGLDTLLGRAATDGLRTVVRCQAIDAGTTPPTCTAQTVALQPLKAITVRARGTISALNTGAQTFTLNYGAGTTLQVNYAQAAGLGKVEGTLANGATAQVKLYGFNAGFFLAREVEVK